MTSDTLGALALLAGALVALALLTWFVLFPDHGMGPDWPIFQAERRAEALLRELLGAEGYEDLNRHGFLEVHSPNRTNRVYLVPRWSGQVRVLENGKHVMWLCAQPLEAVPLADLVVMHKLMIEGNEEEYLKICNRF